MSSQRDLAIDRLATVVKTTNIKTVVQVNQEEDLILYDDTDTPLIQIIATEESAVWGKSMMALWRFNVNVVIFYLDDLEVKTQRENLTKEVRDAIGNDLTLNDTCAECVTLSVSHSGSFPLYKTTLRLRIDYEKSIKNV